MTYIYSFRRLACHIVGEVNQEQKSREILYGGMCLFLPCLISDLPFMFQKFSEHEYQCEDESICCYTIKTKNKKLSLLLSEVTTYCSNLRFTLSQSNVPDLDLESGARDIKSRQENYFCFTSSNSSNIRCPKVGLEVLPWRQPVPSASNSEGASCSVYAQWHHCQSSYQTASHNWFSFLLLATLLFFILPFSYWFLVLAKVLQVIQYVFNTLFFSVIQPKSASLGAKNPNFTENAIRSICNTEPLENLGGRKHSITLER